jgi:glycosyltransferase involved in cell wall biosynthesis
MSLLYVGNKLSKKGSNPSTIDTLSQQLQREGFQVRTVSGYSNQLLRLVHMWLSIIRYSSTTDVVLIDTYSTLNFWYAYTCSVWCRLFKLPYVPILHGGNLPARFQKNPKQAMALVHHAYRTVIPSTYLQEHLKPYHISRSVVITNTLELVNYPFYLRTMSPIRLLWVRAIDAIYNPEMALQTLVILRKTHPDAQLTMVGPHKGISEYEWQQTLDKYQLAVTMTGSLSKETWIALAKEHTAFINTTTVDNMPVSVMEAMALGLPVVSTNVGGMPNLIEQEVTGLLVPSNDSEAMAQAIESLLLDSNKTHRIITQARERILAFDWSNVRVKWLDLLQ